MKKRMFATAILAGAITSASAAVYIAPSDIDTYKQKTDQAFYDLYQNKDSVVAKGANPNMKPFTNAVDTSNRMFEGETIAKVAQGSVAGDPIKPGTSGKFSLAGNEYTIQVDDQGQVRISGKGVEGKSLIRLKDTNAVQKSAAKCVSKGKYGCERYQRTAEEYFFDGASAVLTTSTVKQDRNYKCGKYGCSMTNDWHTVSVVNLEKKQLKVSDLLRGNELTGKAIHARFGDLPSHIGNGKYS